MHKLPAFFRPLYINNSNLIRVGSDFDGGYVLFKKSIINTKHLITYGIADNFDFEKSFQKISNCSCTSYDYSIGRDFWINKFKKDIIKFLQFKIFKYKKFLDLFKFIDFYFFYKKKKNNFFLKKISNKKNCTPFKETIDTKQSNLFLKIDIEGSEYEFIDYLSKIEKKLTGFVIEFHQIEKNIFKIKKFFKKLKTQKLVHVHGCTYSTINKLNIPDIIECTFANRKYLKKISKKKQKKYPLRFLDRPNSKRHSQFNLE